MLAFVLPAFGQPAMLTELDTPIPTANEVRVRVYAASVNGFDLAVAAGMMEGVLEHRFPVVLGKDFAGVIDAIGDGVDGYAVGDRVFGVVTKPFLGDGSFAEYVSVPIASGLAKIPDGVSFTDAAALGLAGTAALDSVTAASIAEGDTVLIAGATGGVGTQAVQLAALAGAHVIATAHTSNEVEQLYALGAAATLDYAGDVPGQLRELAPSGVNVVLHLAGDPSGLTRSFASGGRFVSTLLQTPEQLFVEDVEVIAVYAAPAAETLAELGVNQASGRTRVIIEREYPLREAADAIMHFRTGTLGKLVIAIGS